MRKGSIAQYLSGTNCHWERSGGGVGGWGGNKEGSKEMAVV